jgi:DeoR/GlpR family transcriptional regulator of sugar metabolism
MLVKHQVIKKARKSVAMCSSDKFTCLMPYTFAELSDVDYLISNNELPDPVAQAAKDANVIVL